VLRLHWSLSPGVGGLGANKQLSGASPLHWLICVYLGIGGVGTRGCVGEDLIKEGLRASRRVGRFRLVCAPGQQRGCCLLAALQSGHAAHACGSCMSSAARHSMGFGGLAVKSHKVWCADSFTYTYDVPGFEPEQQGFLLVVSDCLPLLPRGVQMVPCRSVLGASERGDAVHRRCEAQSCASV
jgi:hypothetical protein